MHIGNIEDLLVHEMKDLYNAEQMLGNELTKLADQAQNETLKSNLQEYAQDAKEQVEKFKEGFRALGQQAETEECKGMEGIIEQADDVIQHVTDPATRDAAIIAEVQKMKHYEIAGYGCVRAYAELLGQGEVQNMAAEVIQEEKNIDKQLSELAMSTINPMAA